MLPPESNYTTITLAHLLSSIAHCDKIIVLDKGWVEEEGTHNEVGTWYPIMVCIGMCESLRMPAYRSMETRKMRIGGVDDVDVEVF